MQNCPTQLMAQDHQAEPVNPETVAHSRLLQSGHNNVARGCIVEVAQATITSKGDEMGLLRVLIPLQSKRHGESLAQLRRFVREGRNRPTFAKPRQLWATQPVVCP